MDRPIHPGKRPGPDLIEQLCAAVPIAPPLPLEEPLELEAGEFLPSHKRLAKLLRTRPRTDLLHRLGERYGRHEIEFGEKVGQAVGSGGFHGAERSDTRPE